jgi:hypothetical protein
MRLVPLALALLALGCASPRAVTLDGYRGVYSTHFEDIPDQTGICAVITNHGDRPLGWVRLKLRAFSYLGEVPGQWTSYWLYAQPLAAGETIVVEFEDPPSTDQIELSVNRWGDGQPPRRGRPLHRSSSCSEAGLQRKLESRRGGLSTVGARMLPVLRRNDPSPDVEGAQGG